MKHHEAQTLTQNPSMHIYLHPRSTGKDLNTHKRTQTHRHTHTVNLRHREASYVSIFSHCGSISLSACRPASCKMEGEKYAFSGQLRKTQDMALSFLFRLDCCHIDFSHTILSVFPSARVFPVFFVHQ